MDVFVKTIFILLLFFTPFAFAGTEPWGFSILQGGVVTCWILLLCSRRKIVFSSVFKPVFFTLLFLSAFTALQACFSKTLLDPVALYPVSLMPLYSWEHVSLFVTYLAVVGLVPQLFVSQQDVKKLLFWVVVSAVAVAICAVSFPKGDYIFQLAGVRGGIGPFLNRNHASVFFVLGALAALGVFFTSQLNYGKLVSRTQKQAFYIKQVCFFAVFVSLCVAAVMTRSRGGMLSLLIGLFTYSFLIVWAVPRQFQRKIKGFLITLVVLVLTSGWIYTHVDDINAFARRSSGASEQTRQMIYRSAGTILKQYPVWGIGVGAMPVVITSYTEWSLSSYIERLHNDWLEILLGVGFVGALPIVFGLIWFIYLALKRLKRLEIRKQFLFAALLSALAAMSVGSLVDFHFFIPANALLFFVLLGAVCSLTYAKHHVHEISLNGGYRIGIIVILLAVCYLPLQKTLAWRCYVFGKGLKTQAKLAQYEQALVYYPSPRYAVRLGNAYLNASNRAATPEEKAMLREQAREIAIIYLGRYPRDKELSQLYMRLRPY